MDQALQSHPRLEEDASLISQNVQHVLMAHLAVGAFSWGTAIAQCPAAVLIVLATLLAIGFALHERKLSAPACWGLILACAGSVLIAGMGVSVDEVPSWLKVGLWNPYVQASCLSLLLFNCRKGRTEVNRLVSDQTLMSDGPTPQSVSLRPLVERESVAPYTSDHSVVRAEANQTASMKRRLLIAVIAGVIAYLVVLPVCENVFAQFSPQPQSRAVEDMTLSESIRLRAVQIFAGAWAFSFGACIGSFLNVLVYRQPRGESVLTRPSACPACDTQIETRDNIPVIGWLMLNGRCRACGEPISARYPIVEALAGLIFAALVFVELTSGGANLPVRRPNHYTGFVWTVFYPKWDLIALTIYHFYMFAMLFTWSLMRLDRVVVPWRSILPAWVIAIALPLAWGKLCLVPADLAPLAASQATPAYPQEFVAVATTLFAGTFVALVLAALLHRTQRESFPAIAAPFVLIGATLGWQALLSIAILAFALKALSRIAIPVADNLSAYLLGAALIHHIVWRQLFKTIYG